MKTYQTKASIEVLPNGKTEVLYEVSDGYYAELDTFLKEKKERGESAVKEVKKISKKEKVKAFLKKVVEKQRAKKEKVSSEEDKLDGLKQDFLEAHRIAENREEATFFRQKAREDRARYEKELREKYNLEFNVPDKFLPIYRTDISLVKALGQYSEKGGRNNYWQEFESEVADVKSGKAKPYKSEMYGDKKVYPLSSFKDSGYPSRGRRYVFPKRTQKYFEPYELITYENSDGDMILALAK